MKTLLDTGPLVAYLNRREHKRHPWAKRTLARLPAPFYTCEAVLCEGAHLLKREQGGSARFRAFLDRAPLVMSFSYAAHAGRISELMETYADTPMDFADACLLALYETEPEAQVLTTDGASASIAPPKETPSTCSCLLCDRRASRRHGENALHRRPRRGVNEI